MLVVGYRYDENTHKTLDYFRTMQIDLKNIDKNDKNRWKTIYEAINETYFVEGKLFPKLFFDQCKKHPYDQHKMLVLLEVEKYCVLSSLLL